MSAFESLPAELQTQLKALYETNMTKKAYRSLYPAVSPTRPELSQAGKVVLVSGGGTGVGFAIARAFVRASADTVLLVGRRTGVLEAAKGKLEEEAKALDTKTKVIVRSLDVTDLTALEAYWKELADLDINVDVYVANVAMFTPVKGLLDLGAKDTWAQFEVNVKSPLYWVEKFAAQAGDKQRFIINVSTQATHMAAHPGVTMRPGYTISKLSGTLVFQAIAQTTPHDKIQVISFHPGLIYNDEWKATGISPEIFDDDELCGGFAVWAASKQAAFLHGRFVWAAWDVDELATGEIRKRIDEDFYFLRGSIVGLNGALKA